MTVFYVGMFLFALYVLLLILRPYWAFYMALIIKPIFDMSYEKTVVYDLNLSKLFSAIIIINLLIIALVDFKRLVLIRKYWLVLVWILFTLLSFIVASLSDVMSGLNNLFRYANFVLPFICVPLVIYRKESLFFKIVLIASIIPTAITVTQLMGVNVGYYEGTIGGLMRPRGFFHDSFTNRLYFLYGMVASLYFIINSKDNFWKIGSGVYFFLSVFCLYNIHSKSGFAAIIFFMIILILSLKKFAKIITIAVVLVLTILLFSQVHLMFQTVYQKEIRFIAGKEKQERLFQGRVYGWKEHLKEWSDLGFEEQLFGSGKQYPGMHNDFLRILLCNGIVGFLFFLLYLGYILLLLIKDYASSRLFLCVLSIALVLAFIVDSIGLVPTLYPAYNWMVWGVVSYTLSRKALAITTIRTTHSQGNARKSP